VFLLIVAYIAKISCLAEYFVVREHSGFAVIW